MRFKLLLISLSIAITVSACSKKTRVAGDDSGETPTDTTKTNNPSSPADTVPYTLVENFEAGTKGGYPAGDVTLSTGTWNFSEALIGDLATDKKIGDKSARFRASGTLSMNFDIRNVKKIFIKHAKFNNDANTTWRLFISTNQGADYKQLGSDISETNTSLAIDSFAVSDTGKVRFKIVNSSSAIRINIDDITFKGIGNSGVTIQVPDTAPVDTTNTTEVAAPRDITFGPDAPPLLGDNGNMMLGNPSGAEANIVFANNYLIDHKYFAESYSSTRSTPNWVSWHIDATNITGAVKRQDNFAALASLPSGWFLVQSNSYSSSGFDRGHNCPSADRTSSYDANSATFLMTNMIPQAPENNQKTWAGFENYLRGLVTAGNEVFVIMGSYGTGGTGSKGTFSTIANGSVTVPSNVWKIAVVIPNGSNDAGRINSSTRVIAINTPNTNSINQDWKSYIVTVQELETATGYQFFTNLPVDIRATLKSKRDSGN
ncbi:DNA/RNA non-specific endonuclease [Desertivirga brevis]|uniref:DNA/RNA non-specific endonuclease n=1 Tax=Desertivirga brevis TaxID=2810310 RepID=UPI001A964A8D|nr:DNA/RNA non-specific endonuclease [Pedobacter sp. SYSU D00873]